MKVCFGCRSCSKRWTGFSRYGFRRRRRRPIRPGYVCARMGGPLRHYAGRLLAITRRQLSFCLIGQGSAPFSPRGAARLVTHFGCRSFVYRDLGSGRVMSLPLDRSVRTCDSSLHGGVWVTRLLYALSFDLLVDVVPHALCEAIMVVARLPCAPLIQVAMPGLLGS